MKTFYKESEDGGHSIELSKVRETETEEEEGQQDPQQLSLAYLEVSELSLVFFVYFQVVCNSCTL